MNGKVNKSENVTQPSSARALIAHSRHLQWPPSRPRQTTCSLNISFSFHGSKNLKRPTGESYAPFRHLRTRYSTSPPFPLPNRHRPHHRLLLPSWHPGENHQGRIYRRRSAHVRRTTRTTSPRRKPSATTTLSGMSTVGNGHKTGCSEQNQKGVSKSTWFSVRLFFVISRASGRSYAHVVMSVHHKLSLT